MRARLPGRDCPLFRATLRGRSAPRHPNGRLRLHEVKHDGFRILARRDGAGVRLITRHGNDFTSRFPLAAAAMTVAPTLAMLS
jgi:ATP-dependent DNA ligase